MSPFYDVVILYEDQRGATGRFALHELVMACVYDEVDGDRSRLERSVKDIPKKGNTKLLNALRYDLDDLRRGCRHVVAVFDEDKIRKPLKLSKTAGEEEVARRIKGQAGGEVHVCLLKRNIETLIENVRDCDKNVKAEKIKRALNKDLVARDLVLGSVVPEQMRNVRDCIRKKNPSFNKIVEQVCRLVSGNSSRGNRGGKRRHRRV